MDISVRTQNLFIFISLVKLIHSHRKYSRKNFFRWRFPKCNVHSVEYKIHVTQVATVKPCLHGWAHTNAANTYLSDTFLQIKHALQLTLSFEAWRYLCLIVRQFHPIKPRDSDTIWGKTKSRATYHTSNRSQ